MVMICNMDELIAFLVNNNLLTPVTPNDPGLIFRVITFVEEVKLMHVHKSRVYATYSEGLDAFLVKMTFDPCDPKWLQMNFKDHNILEREKFMHMHKSRINVKNFVLLDASLVKMTFLTPVTHPDLWPHHCFWRE